MTVNRANFAVSTVAAGSTVIGSAVGTSVKVADASRFPSVPFWAAMHESSASLEDLADGAELVYVHSFDNVDTYTVDRGGQDTDARADIAAGWLFYNTETADEVGLPGTQYLYLHETTSSERTGYKDFTEMSVFDSLGSDIAIDSTPTQIIFNTSGVYQVVVSMKLITDPTGFDITNCDCALTIGGYWDISSPLTDLQEWAFTTTSPPLVISAGEFMLLLLNVTTVGHANLAGHLEVYVVRIA